MSERNGKPTQRRGARIGDAPSRLRNSRKPAYNRVQPKTSANRNRASPLP